jgi:PAS domain S-box-containing protein
MADRYRVLVVDDDPSTRLMVREVLEPAGFIVEEAEGGRNGLLLVESFRPDLILLDIVMPDMDGFETLRLLRETEHGGSCPVVMITGLQDPGAVETAYESGASDFVTKPINWSLLRLRLRYVLRSSKERRGADRQLLERALEMGGIGAWRWDPETDKLTVSDNFSALLGFRGDEELKSGQALAKIERDDRQALTRLLEEMLSQAGTGVLETSVRLADQSGKRSVLGLRAERVRTNGGQTGLAGIVRDISDQETLQQKLQGLQASTIELQRLLGSLGGLQPAGSNQE